MLKLQDAIQIAGVIAPAAFRRLCVETSASAFAFAFSSPAAFRRLCVETMISGGSGVVLAPAAFRRLCVETSMLAVRRLLAASSRLQAAVC